MNFICPQPKVWDLIYKKLKAEWEKLGSIGSPPPIPLILNGWWYSSDAEKKTRWQETIEWAENKKLSHLNPMLEKNDMFLDKKIMEDENFKEVVNQLSDIIKKRVNILDPNVQKSLFPIEKKEDDKVDSFSYKLDLIERMVELIRINQKCLENKIPVEQFIQGKINFDKEHLFYIPPKKVRLLGSGTPPIHLQPKLLIFLLFRYGKTDDKVYDVIEGFIRAIWDELKLIDFVKTKTGVYRCFTNTRFAANTLRGYGLLKFTKKEAFKTWTLSFTGILVASKFLKDNIWKIPIAISKYRTDIHPSIRESFKALSDYNEFLNTLAFVTKSPKLIKDSPVAAKRSIEMLSHYHKILKNDEFSKAEKKEKCKDIMGQLEEDQDVLNFYHQLAQNLKIGDIIKSK